MVKIGIDLGTTNSLVTIWKDGNCIFIPNSFSDYLTPSIVSLGENDEIFVGKIAKERLISHPDLTIASFKRFMGTTRVFTLDERQFTAIDLSSFVIKQLKVDAENYLNMQVDEAIISVPAYFNDLQRQAVKSAGELAGLKVERIINEPSAAALAYRFDKEKDQTFLVFDFGGGTLDISVVDAFETIIEIISVAGDNHLGGDDFNKIIAEYFCNQNKLDFKKMSKNKQGILLKKAEAVKIKLNYSSEVEMSDDDNGKRYTAILNEKILMDISNPLFKRIVKLVDKALNDAQMDYTNLDEIILVGGSSKMKIIQKFLQYLTKKKPLIDVEPDFAIAQGVGVVAGIKERSQEIKDVILTDICPFSLGIGVINHQDYNRALFSPIIERNSTLPCSKEKIYVTTINGQYFIEAKIYQGEAMYCEENEYLGELMIQVPPAPAGKQKVDVRFTYDINGILEVDILSKATGHKVNKVIINPKVKLTDEQIQKRIEELATLKIHPKENNQNRLIVARAERLFEETYGILRQEISNMLVYFNRALENQNDREIKQARLKIVQFLDENEKALHIHSNTDFDIEDINEEIEKNIDFKDLKN